jgi:hypothetical protein
VNRRTLLATVGASAAGLAGCSGALEEVELTDDGETPQPTEQFPGRTESGMESCSSVGDNYDGERLPVRNLPELGDRFTDLGCPTFEWSTRTLCYHTAAIEQHPVALVSQTERVFLDDGTGGQVRFALANRSGDEVRTHPGTWTVLRPAADSDDWELVASGSPYCSRTLEHEGLHWWHLGIGTELTSDAIDVTTGTAALEEGTYVFAIPVFMPDGDDIMWVAPFEVIDISETEIGATPTPAPDTPADGPPR